MDLNVIFRGYMESMGLKISWGCNNPYGAVLSHRGTPSHHPFWIGIFPEIDHPFWGYPHDYGNPQISLMFPPTWDDRLG